MASMCRVTDAALANADTSSNGSPRGCTNLLHMLASAIRGDALGTTNVANDRQPRDHDFCEEAITSAKILEAASEMGGQLQLHSLAAQAVAQAIDDWLQPKKPLPKPPAKVDLKAVRDALTRAIDPRITIAARVGGRIKYGPGIRQRQPLGRLESHVEFPQAMYEPLRELSQDWILPGVETVPQNTISIVQTNRRFLEAYMAGLSHAFAGEALWRGAPVYLWSTFFRHFFARECIGTGTHNELCKDIQRLTKWALTSELGSHDPRSRSAGETAVVLIRGDLLRRYNPFVYVVESQANGDPALEECMFGLTVPDPLKPMFGGELPPDLIFLGFDRTPSELCSGGPHGNGYYVVLEERLSEPRFGFDIPDDESVEAPFNGMSRWWYDLTWAHFQAGAAGSFSPFPENTYIDDRVPRLAAGLSPAWGASSATTANICLQRPTRLAFHASVMLSAFACAAPMGA
jgi:hypothetical protein